MFPKDVIHTTAQPVENKAYRIKAKKAALVASTHQTSITTFYIYPM